MPDARMDSPAVHRSGVLGFTWKLLVALVILLVLFVGVPAQQAVVVSAWTTLLLWGGLFVMVLALELVARSAAQPVRWSQVALTLGAYGALAIPVVVASDPAKLLDALGPAAALSLAGQLGRRDLQAAMRDWAVMMGLALFAALSIQAMWFLITTVQLDRFLIAVLLPPVLFEAVQLLLSRTASVPRYLGLGIALVAAVAAPVLVFSFTQFDPGMPVPWLVFFDAVVAFLVGAALWVSLLTRPLLEAGSGTAGTRWYGSTGPLGRAFVELSYGPMLIALVMYLPLRLLLQGIS